MSYIDLMVEWCVKYRLEIWAWRLMPNYIPIVPRVIFPFRKSKFRLQSFQLPSSEKGIIGL